MHRHVYVETAMGRMLIRDLTWPEKGCRARLWEQLRDAGWTATRLRFDPRFGWIARAFVRLA